MKQKRSKALLFVLIGIALCIPVVLAALFMRMNMDSDLKKGTVNSVILTHDDVETNVTDKDEIAFFVEAATSGSSIAAAADELGRYRKLDVEFVKYNSRFVYCFYLSDSENNCVYTDPDGNLFLFPSQIAKKLQGHSLLEDYGLSFAEYPTLVLNQGGKAYEGTNLNGEWNFIRADGKKEKQRLDKEKEATGVLPQGEKLNFTFSIEPDYCSVLLSVKDSDLLYSGLYEEMPVIHLEKDTPLILNVSCDWYEKENVSYHGSLTYTMEVFYDIPTLCTIDKNQICPGETLQVTVTHSSSPQIAVIPEFSAGKVEITKEEGVFVATIPVSETVQPGEYAVMIMGSDVEYSIPVTILPAP